MENSIDEELWFETQFAERFTEVRQQLDILIIRAAISEFELGAIAIWQRNANFLIHYQPNSFPRYQEKSLSS